MLGLFGRTSRPSWKSARFRPSALNARGQCFPPLGSRFTSTAPASATLHAQLDEYCHIEAGPNESIFFIDNVFPLRLQWLQGISSFGPVHTATDHIKKYMNTPRFAVADPLRVVERALPPDQSLQLLEVIPRIKDGGVFVKLRRDIDVTQEEAEHKIKAHLEKNPITPWFNPALSAQAALVRGKPWIEDLYHVPSSRLRVEFLPTSPEASATDLTQETLYSLTRRYGKLASIISQPSDSKVVPRYALIDFRRMRYAVMTKNCLHGFRVSEAEGGGKSGTLLKFTYERKVKAHWIRDWIFNHPRIVIPIVAAVIATISVIIFDPIRTFFIKTRISPPLNFQDSRIWKWVRAQADKANSMLSFHRQQQSQTSGLKAVWEDRRDEIQQVQTWLIESANTFIVVQGPRGSAKKELVVDEVLKDQKCKLVIDCKPIQEARKDSATIAAAAAQVGYWPVFSWLNSINSVIDMATQSMFGTKAGFSETVDAQLGNIWQNTASALKKIALENKPREKSDAHMSDDEYLEAHPEIRPVVIIDNFLHKGTESQMLYDKLADWAAALVYSNIAHVIFLTADVSYSKTLSRALPNQTFHQISLSDCSPEVAKRFVVDQLRHLNGEGNEFKENEAEYMKELDTSISALGGRLTDLEFLARMIKGGERPYNAIQQIVKQSAAEILKFYLLDVDRDNRRWSREQAWFLIKSLSESKDASLRYNEVLVSDLFGSNGEDSVRALEQAELISVSTLNGRPSSIKPGKPVYHTAFKVLVEDRVLRSRLDLAIATQLQSAEQKNIAKYEDELRVLASLSRQPREVGPRIGWLLTKLAAAQDKVEKYEKEKSLLTKVIQMEY